MKYPFLILAGLIATLTHFYVVWRHRNDRRYSVSEHAMLSRRTHLIYFVAHVLCEVFFLAYAYLFLLVEHSLYIAFYLAIAFAVLDFVQAVLPSRGRTENIHFAAAYISWCCYLLVGLVALWSLYIIQPYKLIAILFLIPTLGMFIYMHINRSKLYPYQLAMVPLYVIFMLLLTIGAQ